MKKKIFVFAVVTVLLIAAMAGCSSSYEKTASSAEPQAAYDSGEYFYGYDDVAMNEAADMEMAEEAVMPDREAGTASGGVTGTGALPVTKRKIVTTYYLTMETMEYDEAVEHLSQSADQFGGYIENSSIGGRSIYSDQSARYASFTLRIPTERVQEFLSGLDERYNVINSETSSDDITDSYYDADARLRSLEEQRDRLAALRDANAEDGDLQYLLQIEQEISLVNYQIETYYSSLQRMDQSVNYSTVRISLQEVMIYNHVEVLPQSFGERISAAFSGTWRSFNRSVQNFVVSLIWALPAILLLAVIICIALLIVRSVRRKRKASQQRLPGTPEPESAPEEKESQE